MENLLTILFPPKCLICSKVSSLICKNCLASTKPLTNDFCLVCDKESHLGYTHKNCLKPHYPIRFISIFEYEGVVRTVIKKSKYGGMRFYSLKLLIDYGLRLLNDPTVLSIKNEVDFITSVPLSPKKISLRGFNQADIIAQYLAKYIQKKFIRNLILRKRQTESQFKFQRNLRFENVKNAFEINAKYPTLFRKNVLLVDDISTTGATLLECSKKLIESGANSVICFTLSKRLSTK